MTQERIKKNKTLWLGMVVFACLSYLGAQVISGCETTAPQEQTTPDASQEVAQESSQEATPPDQAAEMPAEMPAEMVAETEPEIPTVGEVTNPDQTTGRCGGAAAREWPYHGKVSRGAVTIVEQGPPLRATIDASAGGSMAARTNPFVYLNLKTGQKVEITDLEAQNNDDWDLAFKRVVIRSNSGDSGTGEREVARLTETDLSMVTQAPADNTFKTDDFFDTNCQPITDPIGTLVTAFNLLNPDNPSGSQSWYGYGGGGAGGVTPTSGHVYVIRRKKTSEAFKLQIISWTSGTFTLLWQQL